MVNRWLVIRSRCQKMLAIHFPQKPVVRWSADMAFSRRFPHFLYLHLTYKPWWASHSSACLPDVRFLMYSFAHSFILSHVNGLIHLLRCSSSVNENPFVGIVLSSTESIFGQKIRICCDDDQLKFIQKIPILRCAVLDDVIWTELKTETNSIRILFQWLWTSNGCMADVSVWLKQNKR